MSQGRRALWVGALAAALVVSGVVWWSLHEPADPHAAIPHLPADVPPPIRRAASKATMRAVRQRLYGAMKRAGIKRRAALFMRIFKREHKLEVWLRRGPRYVLFRTFDVCAFSGGLGPKLRRGDYQAPEGFYRVTRRQLNPHSAYHLSFNVGYPNAYDRAHKRTGGSIMVHGSCVSAGCFAMTDDRIEEIFALAQDALRGGQRAFQVHIFPFRPTPEAMRAQAGNPNLAFWRTLKEGYDAFVRDGRPPTVLVQRGAYVIKPG